MSELNFDDFTRYFEAVHGRTPFPWQRRLLAQVATSNSWPDLLDLPTGSGKTSVLDVALFWLAMCAHRPGIPASRRIVMTVDRRTVVDQAAQRAHLIRDRLLRASTGVLVDVRNRLASLSRGRDPLQVAVLRGGIARDDAWARSPDQPVIAVSTVDQVGSRLLFRGYGVSESMRPIHAGLLGNDCLLFLDEVHISRPFRDTLRELARYRDWPEQGAARPWQVVEMSATAASAPEHVFRLDDSDLQDSVLRQRLEAAKPVEVREIKVVGEEDKRTAVFAAELARLAESQLRPGAAIGVVVNRVKTARKVHALLREQKGDAEILLVTGRMRPLDREALEATLLGLVGSGRSREIGAKPVIVVATQCIEAGADFDFDVMITEGASLDALRQRFGRLNRMGQCSDARGFVVARSDSVSGKEEDPIYGAALSKTFAWAKQAPALDFGAQALTAQLPADLGALLPPTTRAPVVLPAHLDAWAQTAPAPDPEPDISLWLHGIETRQQPEVRIIWRADLDEGRLRAALAGDEVARADVLERIAAIPPSTLEAMSVPFVAVRRWLSQRPADDFGDVERSTEELDRREELPAARPFVLWEGEDSAIRDGAAIRPERTIVVPSSYGGVRDANWDSEAQEAVPDLAEVAAIKRGRPTLRLSDDTLLRWGQVAVPMPSLVVDDERSAREVASEWLDAAAGTVSGPLLELVQHLRRDTRRRVLAIPSDNPGSLVVLSLRPLATASDAEDPSTEDDAASFTGVEITLREHLAGVARVSRELSERCAIPEELAKDVALAAAWHDAGKVDPRFQRLLHGGSAFEAERRAEPVAKSRVPAMDAKGRRAAQERSGYPKGARHEVASVALALADEAFLSKAGDRDLVLHLIASHHGRCRPFAPVVLDDSPVELAFEVDGRVVKARSDHGLESFDSGIAERFWKLVRRYGWHGLAYLESILRLADHRRSEEERQLGAGGVER